MEKQISGMKSKLQTLITKQWLIVTLEKDKNSFSRIQKFETCTSFGLGEMGFNLRKKLNADCFAALLSNRKLKTFFVRFFIFNVLSEKLIISKRQRKQRQFQNSSFCKVLEAKCQFCQNTVCVRTTQNRHQFSKKHTERNIFGTTKLLSRSKKN